MAKVIVQLYKGQLEPMRSIGKNNTEMRRTEILAERYMNTLKDTLDGDAREAFEKYVACMNKHIVLISEQAFCDGFCMGARILSEAVSGAEQLL